MQSYSCENALLLECIVRLLKETSADDTGARAVSARGLLAQIDAQFVYLLHFFTEIYEKINKISQQLLISKLTVDRTTNPSFLGFKFFNYREAIRAFPNHTAGFHTRLMVLQYILKLKFRYIKL